ncbi:hypothetical protein [Thermococcus piezophilus]|nr:hypothetical protein [Thermococcus piezophilus]
MDSMKRIDLLSFILGFFGGVLSAQRGRRMDALVGLCPQDSLPYRG